MSRPVKRAVIRRGPVDGHRRQARANGLGAPTQRRHGAIFWYLVLALGTTLAVASCGAQGTSGGPPAATVPPARATTVPLEATSPSSSSLDVTRFGAQGDGRADDTQAFRKALREAAATTHSLLVPKGTYRLGALAVPDGVVLAGAGPNTTWLKGRVDFGSNDTFRDLKIGDAGDCAVHNLSNASHTQFVNCRFRGGGGIAGETTRPVVALGYDGSCDHITFSDCVIERNLGVEDYSQNGGSGYGFNNVFIVERSGQGGAHVEYVTFLRCAVGASNGSGGHDIGSPRGGLEAYCDGSQGFQHGWTHIDLIDCTFEATDRFCVDLADGPLDGTTRSAAGPALISGCTLKGGGYAASASDWGNTLCLECPEGVIVEGNTIYRSYLETVDIAHYEGRSQAPGAIFRGNTFDLATPNGIIPAPGRGCINLNGRASTFTGNLVESALESTALLQLYDSHGVLVEDNRFIDLRSDKNPFAVKLWNASDNTLRNNVFTTRGAHDLQISAENASGNTITGNVFKHR